MKVKFLGVGEAFDESLPNTSILVRDGESRALLDCGYSAPPAFWRNCPDPDELDAIWVSHFHADHYFGIPALLTRFWESKRRKPILIVGQEGVDDIVTRALRLAYPSIIDKLGFNLQFLVLEPGKTLDAAGLTWRAALNGHPQRDLAVRIEKGNKSVFYSGDGLWTEETLSLARGCGLIIHEAFRLDQNIPGHGNMMGCIEFARRAKAGSLALVHMQRDERRMRRDEILRTIGGVEDLRVFMPEPGEETSL